MNNKDILRQINRKKTPIWIYVAVISVIAILISVDALFLLRDRNHNDETHINIDTSLIDEGEEDPENVESEEETGVEVKVDELIVGSDRINAIDVS